MHTCSLTVMHKTFDLTSHLDQRFVARQPRHSILSYMASDELRPALQLDSEVLRHLFERAAPAVDMYTNESPDEQKPKLAN